LSCVGSAASAAERITLLRFVAEQC